MIEKSFSATAIAIADYEIALGTLNLLASKGLITEREYFSVFDEATKRLRQAGQADQLDAAELIELTRASIYVETE